MCHKVSVGIVVDSTNHCHIHLVGYGLHAEPRFSFVISMQTDLTSGKGALDSLFEALPEFFPSCRSLSLVADFVLFLGVAVDPPWDTLLASLYDLEQLRIGYVADTSELLHALSRVANSGDYTVPMCPHLNVLTISCKEGCIDFSRLVNVLEKRASCGNRLQSLTIPRLVGNGYVEGIRRLVEKVIEAQPDNVSGDKWRRVFCDEPEDGPWGDKWQREFCPSYRREYGSCEWRRRNLLW
ncbi:hypothetical protein BKA93DRAFT_773362 [Sparassis latifolia]